MSEVKNYQTMSDELNNVITALQAPDVDVDEALVLYKRGQAIIKELEKYLKSTENKVRKLTALDKEA